MNELESDVVGFEVEALDGSMGKVADLTADDSTKCLVVKPGMLRRRHVIPVDRVVSVDRAHHRVVIRMTKHQIAASPTPMDLDEPWHEARVRTSSFDDPMTRWPGF